MAQGTVYRVDVELDQLMEFFRVALVNMAAWFLSNCRKDKMSLAHLSNAALMLRAQIDLTDDLRRVTLRRNVRATGSLRRRAVATAASHWLFS